MKELLIEIGKIINAVFTEWIPLIAKANLKKIGTVFDAAGFLKYAIGILVATMVIIMRLLKRSKP